MGKDPRDFEKKNQDWGNEQKGERPGRVRDGGFQDVTDWDKAPKAPRENDKDRK